MSIPADMQLRLARLSTDPLQKQRAELELMQECGPREHQHLFGFERCQGAHDGFALERRPLFGIDVEQILERALYVTFFKRLDVRPGTRRVRARKVVIRAVTALFDFQ